MRLESADVDRYGPLQDCRPSVGDGLTVLSGPNEAGKTLYLEALLRLLEPDVTSAMGTPPRVDGEPTGRVVVENRGETLVCDGTASLCEATALEARHLQSIFVVRDTDLSLPSGQEYYASLVETLGDIHTTEIGAIDEALKDRGRLTSTTLNLSNAAGKDNAKSVHRSAATLAEDIRAYLDEVEEAGIDELASERLRTRRELEETRSALATQEDARAVSRYEHLNTQLETYRSATDALADVPEVDQDGLDTLRELERDLEGDRSQLETVREDIEETEQTIRGTESELDTASDELAALERREPAIEQTRDALQAYRRQKTDTAGADRRLRLTRLLAGGGIVGAGVLGAAGAVTASVPALALAGILVVVAIGAGLLHYRTNAAVSDVETAREAVLEEARDAGLDVAAIEDVGPAIERFETDLETVKKRQTRLGTELSQAEGDLEELRETETDLEGTIEEQAAALEGHLADAGVDTVEAYADLVEERKALEQDRHDAAQRLDERLGDPEAETPQDRATWWAGELDALVADVDRDATDPDTYDQAELERLEAQEAALEEELGTLQERLSEHEETLDAFDERARALETRPFVGRDLSLPARSTAGLEDLADDCEVVMDTIERDAEISRKAVELFERIEDQEEEKMTELFAPDGPASETFAHLTDGRYTEVAYDPEGHELVVERTDGRQFQPATLSQGTTDQLYFASRVSLARQLLGEEPGFLLLDDPFLAADHERLKRGFETLCDLAADGWQILYLTAKREVSETMVDSFDLDHAPLVGIPDTR